MAMPCLRLPGQISCIPTWLSLKTGKLKPGTHPLPFWLPSKVVLSMLRQMVDIMSCQVVDSMASQMVDITAWQLLDSMSCPMVDIRACLSMHIT